MTELSSAAEAVLDAAYSRASTVERGVAAALRAAANYLRSEVSDGCRGLFVQGVSSSAEALEEIANELEAQ